jgi:hypothetical protein
MQATRQRAAPCAKLSPAGRAPGTQASCLCGRFNSADALSFTPAVQDSERVLSLISVFLEPAEGTRYLHIRKIMVKKTKVSSSVGEDGSVGKSRPLNASNLPLILSVRSNFSTNISIFNKFSVLCSDTRHSVGGLFMRALVRWSGQASVPCPCHFHTQEQDCVGFAD